MDDRQPSIRSSALLAVGLGLAAGITVAVVLQDASVMIPLVLLAAPGTAVLHALRHLPHRVLTAIAAAATTLGGGAIVYGHLFSEDGTIQALGVLGGSAAVMVGVLSAVALVATRPSDTSPLGPWLSAGSTIAIAVGSGLLAVQPSMGSALSGYIVAGTGLLVLTATLVAGRHDGREGGGAALAA